VSADLSAAISRAMSENIVAQASRSSPSGNHPVAEAPKPASPPGQKPAVTTPVAPKPAPVVVKPVPAVAKPVAAAAVKPAAPPQAEPIVAQSIAELRKLLDHLQQQDYFARLSLERTKGPMPALKAAFFKLAKIYHPDTVPPDGPEEARKLKADILSLLNEASAVLADDTKGANYLEDLLAREEFGDVDVGAILQAEEDFQRAIVLAKGRRFPDALALIEGCIQVNEKEGEFYAWRGYCKFFGATDKKSALAAALEDQQQALERNPRCVVAWSFKAQFWKLLGDVPKAKEAYNKVLELDPKDIEARRELRLFEQRKQ
jgi:tetratricopeptide (TPR) repeat protein